MEKKKRILIVDDEELICWSLKKSFEKTEQYSVSCVYTGDDALKNISENHYDVVITDLKLPDVNGLELLEKIKGIVKDTPVIVMSAYITHPAMEGIDRHGVFRCVNKPFAIDDVLLGVQEAVQCKNKESLDQ